MNTSNPPATGGGGAGGTYSECGALSGAGNCLFPGGTTGTAGTSGSTGVGGSGGSAPLPACTASGPTFGVCFVNDKDAALPLSDTTTSSSGAATIEAVASGNAPAFCTGARVIGMRDPSQWWFQARAADNRLWTIGVRGLGDSTPLVHQGDVVTLDLAWDDRGALRGFTAPAGLVQLTDAAGTPLLWAGANPDPSTWISFASGSAACVSGTGTCQTSQSNVIATVNGSSMTLPPYGAATLGGYSVQVTHFFGLPPCGDYLASFEAAAAKISP